MTHLRDVERKINEKMQAHPNGRYVDPWLTHPQAQAIIEAIGLIEAAQEWKRAQGTMRQAKAERGLSAAVAALDREEGTNADA